MEFYADASSLLIAIYQILLILFNCINTFYAELSISKKIYFFKEFEDHNLNLQKHSKKINKLLFESKIESFQNSNFHKQVDNKNKKAISPNLNDLSNDSNDIEKSSIRNSSRKLEQKIEIFSRRDVESVYNVKNNKIYNNSKKIEEIQIIDNNQKKINFDFNVFEIIRTSFCKYKCCLNKNLELKNNVNEKANNFLNYNLDIVCYIRNQILFDIINETILDEQFKSIVNFLCRPIISKNQDLKNDFSDFYRKFEEKDFEKFSQELFELIQKPNKSIKEKKLLNLSNNHLNDYFNNI